jgi:DNA-binding NtrC family response regulator
MNFETIIYGMPPGSDPVSKTIHIDGGSAPKDLPGIALPAVIVLKDQDTEDQDHLCEKKDQKTAIDLGRIFINRKENEDRLFVLVGKYRGTATLENAIKKFLVNANKVKEEKAYFISVKGIIFEKIAEKVAKKTARETCSSNESLPDGSTVKDRYNSVVTEKLPRDEELARNILELMERDGDLRDDGIVRRRYRGDSYSCRLVRQRIMMAAGNRLTVMIEGERGTGKEEVAKAIHHVSTPNAPFVSLNSSAIPPLLLEAELFGVRKDYPEKGGKGKIGLWSAAGEGTLFLDEIGELAPDHQAKILRALETRRILPVGATKEEPVHARVVAATNRNSSAKDKYGKHLFRQDLYDRLKQIYIRTPALKSHPRDIPEFATSIWEQLTGDNEPGLHADLIDLLMKQSWDDNVRGMRNVLEDLHNFFPTKPTMEKLKLLLQYRKTDEEGVITQEKVVAAELNDMIEILAKASHRAWFRKRESEGWVWGPKRIETDEAKTNPDMKPYNDLSEAQKSYAREEARAVLRAILDEGYSIAK